MAEKELTFEQLIWAVEIGASMHQAAKTLSQIAGRNITAQDVNRMLRLYALEPGKKRKVELAKKAMYNSTKRLVLIALKEGRSLEAITKVLGYRDRDNLIGTLNILKKGDPKFREAYERIRLGQGRKLVKRIPKPRIRRR
jgi:hypothetical protein